MPSPIGPKDDKEKAAILETALQEARSKYQNLNTDYGNLGTKIFTLIATELVITTFLLTFRLNSNRPIFSLEHLAVIIFFAVGLASILCALGVLFWATTSNRWASPGELKELKQLRFLTHIDFLEELKNDYLEAYQYCRGRYDKRRVAFDSSVIMFVMGAIILMVIKIGG